MKVCNIRTFSVKFLSAYENCPKGFGPYPAPNWMFGLYSVKRYSDTVFKKIRNSI